MGNSCIEITDIHIDFLDVLCYHRGMKFKTAIKTLGVAALIATANVGDASATGFGKIDSTFNPGIILNDTAAAATKTDDASAGLKWGRILLPFLASFSVVMSMRFLRESRKVRKEVQGEADDLKRILDEINAANAKIAAKLAAAAKADADAKAAANTIPPIATPAGQDGDADKLTTFKSGDNVRVRWEGRVGTVRGTEGEITLVKIDGKDYKYRTDDLAKID